MAIEEAPHGLPLIGPCVLVGDDDRNARQASEDGRPEIGPEHMGVDDIDSLGAEQRQQSAKRLKIEPPAALERDVPHALRQQALQERAVARPGRHDRHLETVPRQIRRDRHDHTFGAAATLEAVDEQHHASPVFGRSRGLGLIKIPVLHGWDHRAA